MSMNLRLLLISVLSIGLVSCGRRGDGRFFGAMEEVGYPAPADSLNLIEVDESVFPEVVPMKGAHIEIEPVIKPMEMSAIVKDDLMFVKHLEEREGEPSLHVFRLPGMELVASMACRGNGPGEVMDIRISASVDPDKYCFIYDVNKHFLYYVDKNLKVHSYKRDIVPKNTGEIGLSSNEVIHRGGDRFIFGQMADNGTGLFEMDFKDMIAKGLIDLNCTETFGRSWEDNNNWCAFLGRLCSNPSLRRLVYVYNNYHRVVFSDYDGKDIKVIQFKEQDHFRSKGYWEHMNFGEDTFYYQTAFGSSRYVYFVYKGEVFDKPEMPTYLEQWTWGGEPVRRFLLEDGVYPLGGCVDDKNQTLYLLDVNNDDFIYRVQMDGVEF